MLSRCAVYYGSEQPPTETLDVTAGPLSAVFQDGCIRHIRFGDTEILKRVYVAVRDRNWGTEPGLISSLSISRENGGFTIGYDAEHRQGDIHICWHATIAGGPEGTMVWEMEGEALSTFLRNRIGFCILHPIRECAGRPCRVGRTDGTTVQGVFPKGVSPRQPFEEMRSIAHEVVPGLTAEVEFWGDVFEMEDQRNWTDDSYKIYSTPLRLPFPAEVKAGERVVQTVRLSLKGKIPKRTSRETRRLTFSFDSTKRTPLPKIGLGIASHGGALSSREAARLRALNISHLRADVVLSGPTWRSALARAADQSRTVGVPLELAVTVSDSADREFAELAASLRETEPDIARWLIFHDGEKSPSRKWVDLARQRLSKHNTLAQFVSGTNGFFAELNRERPDVSCLDGACFSVNPQVHLFDNDALVENLNGQAAAVDSARQFLGALPIMVTPVTLRPRFNPAATSPEGPSPPGALPPEVDLRQMSLFGAGWTLGSLKYLAESGVNSITYYETTGWRGVMETEQGSPLPGLFRSFPGGVFPIYHMFADVGEFATGEVIASESSRPLVVAGIVLRRRGLVRIILANLTVVTQRVTLDAIDVGHQVRRNVLDECNAETAMRSPEAFRCTAGQLIEVAGDRLELTLRPFAVVRLDAVEKSRSFE